MKRRNQRGSNAVEFALTLPVLVVMLSGLIDYGWYFSQHQAVLSAVREATRAGTLAGEDEDAAAIAIARAQEALTQAGLNGGAATVDVDFLGAAPNLLIEVDVSVPFSPLMGTLALLGDHTYPPTLNGRLVARIEDQ